MSSIVQVKVLSAVAEVTGMVMAICNKLNTSQGNVLLLGSSHMTSHNAHKFVTFLIEVDSI